MTDEQFEDRITEICYKQQIEGYPEGHPGRINFKPIVPLMYDTLGEKINRFNTLGLISYSNIPEDVREELLNAG